MVRRLNGTPIREPTEKDVRQVRVKRTADFADTLIDDIETILELFHDNNEQLNTAEFLLGSFYAVGIVYRKILKQSLEEAKKLNG